MADHKATAIHDQGDEAVIGTFWAVSFDADLLKVVPGIEYVVDELADVVLHTQSRTTNERINCPSAWHTDHGLTSFFSSLDRFPAPPGFHSFNPLVRCTWMEVLRDEWVHSAEVVVNGRHVWSPPNDVMQRLMFHLRGWVTLTDKELTEQRELASQSVHGACEELLIALDNGSHWNPEHPS